MNIFYVLKLFTFTEILIFSIQFMIYLYNEINRKIDLNDGTKIEIKMKICDLNRFLKSYNDTTCEWNSNINQLFHDRENFKDNINDLEKIWFSRKLMVNTERGNIIMFYNVFNECFSYYSDQSGIPYDILNKVIMKYVLIYRCRDFFIDESLIPEGFSSPFVDYIYKEEALENSKKKMIKDKLLLNDMNESHNSPFAKLKNRNPQISASSKRIINLERVHILDASGKVVIKRNIQNRLIYLGKINNCDMLQITDSNKHKKLNLSSYKDFKSQTKYHFENSSIFEHSHGTGIIEHFSHGTGIIENF